MLSWDAINSKLWLAWFVCWVAFGIIGARGAPKNETVEPLSSRAPYFLALILAFGILFNNFPFLDLQLLPPILGPYGVCQTALGLLFAIWARIHLGKYWSGRITLKEGHRLIRTGPYRWVRHPIYTGVLCAFSGSALSDGKPRALIALMIMTSALYRKISIEERVLNRRFGREYQDYCRETGLLVPQWSGPR